ncbi:hypothetical protein C8A01DRAFT_37400 [Parachaetomium inaequale]|uniref:Uncharacterized protein n=1 Tax=Parachaetomium inaequale TaxID=2588326 RepID=A0AAN6SQQ1_9PEZI|nr:hypothetical protein C8A01DRAFT_37400 [Parachaetomium inaequale]
METSPTVANFTTDLLDASPPLGLPVAAASPPRFPPFFALPAGFAVPGPFFFSPVDNMAHSEECTSSRCAVWVGPCKSFIMEVEDDERPEDNEVWEVLPPTMPGTKVAAATEAAEVNTMATSTNGAQAGHTGSKKRLIKRHPFLDDDTSDDDQMLDVIPAPTFNDIDIAEKITKALQQLNIDEVKSDIKNLQDDMARLAFKTNELVSKQECNEFIESKLPAENGAIQRIARQATETELKAHGNNNDSRIAKIEAWMDKSSLHATQSEAARNQSNGHTTASPRPFIPSDNQRITALEAENRKLREALEAEKKDRIELQRTVTQLSETVAGFHKTAEADKKERAEEKKERAELYSIFAGVRCTVTELRLRCQTIHTKLKQLAPATSATTATPAIAATLGPNQQ